MSGGRPLPARELIGAMVHQLQRLGFARRYRSATGSVYLTYPGLGPWEIRISDHQYSRNSQRNEAQVIKSVALRAFTAEEAPGLALEFAVGFLVRREARLGLLRRGRPPVAAE